MCANLYNLFINLELSWCSDWDKEWSSEESLLNCRQGKESLPSPKRSDRLWYPHSLRWVTAVLFPGFKAAGA